MANMLDSYKKEVKSLIKTGEFDLELISFEYGIPMDIVSKWKDEIEQENLSYNRKFNSKQDEFVHKKAEELKERYMILYDNVARTKRKNKKDKQYYSELSEEEKSTLRNNISNMQILVKDLDEKFSDKEQIAVVKKVIQQTIKLNMIL